MAHGRKSAHEGMIEKELLFGMTVGPLSTGALPVDCMIEWAIAIKGDAHLRSGFPVEVFDTAFALFELLMLTLLSIGLWEE